MLTPRQVEVLQLSEYSNAQIALRLGISRQTVKNHWTTIGLVLLGRGPRGHRRRTNIVLEALRRGIIRLGEIEKGDRRCPEEWSL